MSDTTDLLSLKGDWSLNVLVSLTRDTPARLPVSLTVPAGLISGILISEVEFFEGITDALAASWPGGKNDSIKEMYASLHEKGAIPLQGFIHLKEAYLVTPGDRVSVGYEGLWRGSLNSVTGYSVGRHGAS